MRGGIPEASLVNVLDIDDALLAGEEERELLVSSAGNGCKSRSTQDGAVDAVDCEGACIAQVVGIAQHHFLIEIVEHLVDLEVVVHDDCLRCEVGGCLTDIENAPVCDLHAQPHLDAMMLCNELRQVVALHWTEIAEKGVQVVRLHLRTKALHEQCAAECSCRTVDFELDRATSTAP